ncbi:MAG: hypothetical protein RLZZ174_522 [Pseudomonadota bacterium]|jgi:multidrug efflux pump subunit AcrB
MSQGALSDLFYRQGRLTALTLGLITVLGLSAFATLARQEDPTMTERYGYVKTFLPGASAERIETLITERLEKKLREIPEIKELRSESRTGLSFINVEFEDRVGPDLIDVLWSEVRDKVNAVEGELPPGTLTPEVEARGPIATTLALALRWTGPGAPPLALLNRLGERLETRLANLPGTKETEIYGEPEEELRVRVDPSAAAAAGLSVEAVATRLRQADTRASAGRLQSANSDLLVEIGGELDSAARVAAIPLARSLEGGQLKVGDLAEVQRTTVDPPATLALSRGERVVVVAAVMEPDQRIDLWRTAAQRELDAFEATLSPRLSLEVIYDQNAFTSARLGDLTLNLVSALIIVFAVLVFFMGPRNALLVGLALPLTLAMVLAGMRFLAIPLHQMSVTGLIISLGLLIDNAIVAVEAYKQARREGAPIDGAVRATVEHLFVPLAASTATTVFAFLPIALTPGGTGEFTGTIAISVVLAVISSFFLAMTIVPALAGFLDRAYPQAADLPRWRREGVTFAGLRSAYARSLRAILRAPWKGIAASLVLPLLGFALAPTLTQQFFPPVDRNQFQIQLSLPPSTPIEQTEAAVGRLAAILEDTDEVGEAFFFLGEGGPRVYYNVLVNSDGLANFAGAFVNTASPEATQRILPDLQRRLREAFPEAQVLALPFEQGPPFDAPIEVRILGDDLAELQRIGERLRSLLAAVPGVTYTRAGLTGTQAKWVLDAPAAKTTERGLSLSTLAPALRSNLSGVDAGFVMEGTFELPIRVRAGNEARSTEALTALPLPAAAPSLAYRGMPLESFGTLRLAPAADTIEHYQGQRVNTVQGFLMPYVLPAAALSAFQGALEAADLRLPSGYRIEFGGEAEQRSESVGNLLTTFVTFLLLMVGVVVLSLNSFRQAGTIGIVGLLSVGLALFGVRLFGYPLGFNAIIGTLGLVGLAINGAIIVLSALKASPEACAGDLDAIESVVMDATRHIISTTVTTIGGFIPLIVFGGTFWPPLATAIAGGVAGSAILALYFVPARFVRQLRNQESPG